MRTSLGQQLRCAGNVRLSRSTAPSAHTSTRLGRDRALTTCFVALPPWVRCNGCPGSGSHQDRTVGLAIHPVDIRCSIVASRLLWIASGSMAGPQMRLVLTFIGGRRESERRTVIWRVRLIRWATSIGGKGADAKGGMAAGGHPSFK